MSDWPEFLNKLSGELLDNADEYELEVLEESAPGLVASRQLGFPAASADAIAVQEATLGIRLPDDYRAFLLASNGFRGLAGRPHGQCSLLPVEEIGWMRDKDARTGRLAGYLARRANGETMPEDFDIDPADFARTLLIGESDGNECVLLLPPRDAEAWEIWTYDPEAGFQTGLTFEALMRSALEQ